MDKRRNTGLYFLQLLAIIAVARNAHGASGWEETFADDSIKTQVPAVATIVVASGTATTDRDQATTAIRKRLAAKGGFLVMDAQSIGQVDALSDKEIIVRCAQLPVVQVVVVRVFESGTDDVQAVATVYDKAGAIKAAFTAKRGKRFAQSPQPPADPTTGISTAASNQIQDVLEGHGKDANADDEKYEEKKKRYYADRLTYGPNEVGKGEYGEKMDLDVFFGKVGRPDLIQRRKQRVVNKTLATIASLGVGILGIVLLANSESCQDVTTSRQSPGLFGQEPKTTYTTSTECTDNGAMVGAGLIMIPAGFLTALFVPLTASSPITNDEGRRLADDHNEKLRKQLGIKEGDVDFKVRLNITQQAASLGLRIAF